MHLDIVVPDVEGEVARLEALGARRIDPRPQSFGGTDWVRIADPEGNELCVSTGVPF
jgi:predicted enzyme related to lactoylglutathione lyase